MARRMRVLLAFVALFLALTAPACKRRQEIVVRDDCRMHPRLEELVSRDVPPPFVDCGCADGGPELLRVKRCAAEAFANRLAFRARFSGMGVDNRFREVVAGTADGRLIVYGDDSSSRFLTRFVCPTPALTPNRSQVYCRERQDGREQIPR